MARVRRAWLGRAVLLLCGVALLGARPGTGPALRAPAPPAKIGGRGRPRSQWWVYVGTYTGKSRGIYRAELDRRSGALTLDGLAAATTNASFLALDPTHRFLYAVNEVDRGTVSAFAIDPATGALTFLNAQSSRGSGPAHLAVDRAEKNVLVANYNSGSVAVLPIGPDGRLKPATGFAQHHGASVNKARQEGPHAHCVTMDPAHRRAYVCDLGLDKVMIYQLDPAAGLITPNSPPFAAIAPGSGPRHLVFHPNGRFAYVISEMASTVTACRYHPATGALEPLQTVSTLPAGFTGTNTAAEVQVYPSGRFLYASNRGRDSIARFAINPHTGRLTPRGDVPSGGRTPRHFAIDPSGVYLLAENQDSDNVVVFRINPKTGALAPTGHTSAISKPVCVVMMAPPG